MTYTLIAHQELASAQSEIQFASIPATFTDLLLVFSTRSSANTVSGRFWINNDTTQSNYFTRIVYAVGSGNADSIAGATTGDHNGVAGWLNQTPNYTAGIFNSTAMYFPNYRASNVKSISTDSVIENNAGQSFQMIGMSIWNNTAAINNIRILDALGGNQVQFSSATLYGITAGSSGGVVVS
jgi:hypothetical protein